MSIAHLDVIAESIVELLRERHKVDVPDLGAFTGVYESAEVDRIQKIAKPPVLRIDFRRDLRANDGMLLGHLMDRYGWTPQEAEKRLATFVREVEKQLERRQIVEFPGLGKLYIDFDKQYKFIQSGGNLNKATFGLPEVPLEPVKAKDEEPAATAVAEPAVASTAPTATAGRSSSSEKLVTVKPASASWLSGSAPWVILMLLIILSVSGYFLWQKIANPDKHAVAPVAEEQGEEGTSAADSGEGTTAEGELLFEDDAEDLADLQYEEELAAEESGDLGDGESPAASMPEDSEAPTLPPDVQEAVIVIGSFSQPKNAERLIQRLYEDGYDAYSDRKAGRTRVGIRFSYRGEAELMDYLEQMKNKYNVDAWILGQ